MRYKIVMDSSANILTLDGVDFSSVPLKIVTDEREFTDNTGLDLDEMMDYLHEYRGRSGTSCPNVGEWLEAFGDAEGVFALCITGTLSGSYNAAVQAKNVYEENHPGRRVCCLDTLSTGPEMGLLAEKLRDLIAAGKDFDTIEGEIREYGKHTHLIFTLESLNNMARNGRVSMLVAKACGILGIRILAQASSEGTLQPLHKCRGEKKAITTMLKEMKERGFRGGKVRIDHCRNEQGARAFLELLRAEFPNCPVHLGRTTALCSFYAEPGGIMVGFEG